MRRPTIFSVTSFLTIFWFVVPSFAGDGHARSHSWSMEQGSLIPNWSFENELEMWANSAAGGMTTVARHIPSGFTARSGRFTGRVTGTTSTSGEILLLRTGLIPVQPNQAYTLSFYVRSNGAVGDNCFPAVRFLTDKTTVSRTVDGTAYAAFSGSSTLGSWTLYTLPFIPDSGEVYADVALWRSASSSVAATLYFDDVVLEEGTLDTTEVLTRRARHAYSVTFSDALGRTHQTHTHLPEDPGVFRVQGAVYDSAGRPLKTPLPFPQTASSPAFVSNLITAANAYYDGGSAPDADGYAYSEVQYAAEPSSRVLKSAAPGEPWRLAGTKVVEAGFRFTDSLSPPGNVKSPGTDTAERMYRLDWVRDEDSAFALTWTNRKGQVVQTARQTEDGWAFTRMDYYPAGQIRRVRTPLDTSGFAFSEVRNYNAAGLLTSSYTHDRGLEKFWYNKRGMPRYSQNDLQREQYHSLATYHDYDHLGNLSSTGEQALYYLDQAVADGDSTPGGKIESRGWLYGSFETFESRTGVPLDTIAFPTVLYPSYRTNALMAAWHKNPESRTPGFTAAEKLVADFYEYDEQGRVTWQHKYLGSMDPSKRYRTSWYQYDDLDRLVYRESFEGGNPYVVLAAQGYRYDALGRVTSMTGPYWDTLSRYDYAPHGPLGSVWLGAGGESGTLLNYEYHVRGWTKEVTAYRDGNGFQTYRQVLGYEARALNESGVPSLTQARYTGQITQQLYKFTSEVSNPIRAVNYSYDMLGRMTTADYRQGSGLDGEQYMQFPLSLTDTNTLATRVAYDVNGRILGKRSGGISSADSAVYNYDGNSYRLESVEGKLSPTRDASRYYNFSYDAAGRMTRDVSKGLETTYGYDGMPVEMAVRQGHEETALHPLYDAGGYRVSQVAAPRLAHGFPVYWVGNAQGDEDAGLYTALTVDHALADASYQLNFMNYPPPDSLVLYVVLDEGDSVYTPEFGELEHVTKGDTVVPVILHGVVKFSARYDSLMVQRAGRKAFARYEVSMGGWIAGEIREVYDTGGSVTASAMVGNVYGRGTPIGRWVHTDTGEVFQFFIKNHLGSTVRVVNADGSYATTPVFDYQPYGELQVIREDSLNPVTQKYTGKGLDTEVNLYYFGARWYDQELGMWTTVDPVNDGFNPYGYVGGDPLSYIDPFGMKKCKGFLDCTGSFFSNAWQGTSNTVERTNNKLFNKNCNFETNDACRDNWTRKIEEEGRIGLLQEACASGDAGACRTLNMITIEDPVWGGGGPSARRYAQLMVMDGQKSIGITYISGPDASAATVQYGDITIPVYYDNHAPEISKPSRDVGSRSGANNRAVVRSRPVEGSPFGNHAFIELQNFQNGEWTTSTTLSAFKEGPFLDGYLNARLGGDLNHIAGSQVDFTIYGANDVLLQRFNSFRNNTVSYRTASPYGGYNSNGFINGLLQSSGFRYYSPNSWAPYHDKPVPGGFFY